MSPPSEFLKFCNRPDSHRACFVFTLGKACLPTEIRKMKHAHFCESFNGHPSLRIRRSEWWLSLGTVVILLLFSSCRAEKQSKSAPIAADTQPTPVDLPQAESPTRLSALDSVCLRMGLVDILKADTSLRVHLAYSTPDNFLGEDVYGEFDRCYLQPEVTEMLIKAHGWLKTHHPELRLLVFDGVRPQSVQQKMWDLVKGTEKNIYVSPPGKGSLHNFGCAVDLTLTHLDTGEVDMGTPFDFFGPEAQPRLETEMLQAGKIDPIHIKNRAILNEAMAAGGFRRLLTEWWHFNAMTREEAAARYRIVP